eukprot:COSAG01_NODE_25603_length_740_cov_0.725429_1_plen_89_part_10
MADLLGCIRERPYDFTKNLDLNLDTYGEVGKQAELFITQIGNYPVDEARALGEFLLELLEKELRWLQEYVKETIMKKHRLPVVKTIKKK